MTSFEDPRDVYRSIGVKPVITASGPTTAYGGSKLRTEVMDAVNAAATVMVNMDELNRRAGELIAKHTGAEAGFVSSGSAGGLLLQAAACIAGSDPVRMSQLPTTDGLKNEIIIHNIHRFPYDNMYTAAGAKLVGVGDFLRCLPWQMEAAINEKTAAIAYLEAPFVAPRAMPSLRLALSPTLLVTSSRATHSATTARNDISVTPPLLSSAVTVMVALPSDSGVTVTEPVLASATAIASSELVALNASASPSASENTTGGAVRSLVKGGESSANTWVRSGSSRVGATWGSTVTTASSVRLHPPSASCRRTPSCCSPASTPSVGNPITASTRSSGPSSS